jgi:hypothetical protein
MPVPPQENATSLSPGQSFGCQYPLPWVTGTDRTGSLQALWKLQGSTRSSLLPLCTLSPGGILSYANKPHTVQYCVVSIIPWENRHRLSKNWFKNHRIPSQSQLRNRECSHRLAQLPQTRKDSSPNSAQVSRKLGLHTQDFLESDIDIRVTGSPKGSLQESG